MKMLVLIIFSSVIIAFIEEWIFRGLYSAKNTYASECIIIQEWGFENLSAWIHSWALGMSLECRQMSRLLLPPGWAGTQAPAEALWGNTFCVSLGLPWGEGGQEACLLSLQLWERRHTAQKRGPSSDAGQGGSCVARKPCQVQHYSQKRETYPRVCCRLGLLWTAGVHRQKWDKPGHPPKDQEDARSRCQNLGQETLGTKKDQGPHYLRCPSSLWTVYIY